MFDLFSQNTFLFDPLALFFLGVIALVSVPSALFSIGYLKGEYSGRTSAAASLLLALFVFSMAAVALAGNLFTFLVFWELMSVSSYFLVVFDHKHEKSVRAGTLYLIMTHIGTACLMAGFFILYTQAGSFDFAAVKQAAAIMPSQVKNTVFALLFFGFAVKAGVVPLHIWLPIAHPQAPSHISSIMSGVMIKIALYGMIRFFLVLLGPGPAWWGGVILAFGALSCLVGVIYALIDNDLKKVLAYSSVENIGIILLGIGTAMLFSSYGITLPAMIGLCAALYHLVNHALFKGLLFLGAGSVVKATGIRDMEKMGGLIKVMPWTAAFFLIGAMGIAALPPLNGFVSEWLTFQAFFAGITHSAGWIKITMVLCAATLALTGGFAAACFVKVFGITFLAMPRSYRAEHAKEGGLSLKLGMGFLACMVVLFGVGAGVIAPFISKIAHTVLGVPQSAFSFQWFSVSLADGQAAAVSPLLLAGVLLVTGVVAVALLNKKPRLKTKGYHTWGCGYYALDARTEYTGTAFAKPFRVAFSFFLLPYRKSKKIWDSFYHVRSFTYETHTTPIFERHFYEPLVRVIYAVALKFRKLQPGIINLYLFYIFLAVVLLVAMIGVFNL